MPPTLLRGIAAVHKIFNQTAFDKYDEAARSKAKAFWAKLGWTVTDNPDVYGVDLVAEKDGKRFYVEVEVKSCWHGVKFTYDTLHLPVRKGKFLSKPTQFMLFNHSLTHAAVVDRRAVLSAPVSTVPNRQISAGEKFFDIPLKDVTFVYTMT